MHCAKLSEKGPEKVDLYVKIKVNNTEKNFINNYIILLFPLNSRRWKSINTTKYLLS